MKGQPAVRPYQGLLEKYGPLNWQVYVLTGESDPSFIESDALFDEALLKQQLAQAGAPVTSVELIGSEATVSFRLGTDDRTRVRPPLLVLRKYYNRHKGRSISWAVRPQNPG